MLPAMRCGIKREERRGEERRGEEEVPW